MSDSTYDQLQTEVQEIYDVLRRWHPDRSIVDLWNEALPLHRVRFETEILPPRDPKDRPVLRSDRMKSEKRYQTARRVADWIAGMLLLIWKTIS